MLLIKVFGDVIGVGFRATTQRLANDLGLIGYVRNRPDGTVEIGLDASQTKANQLIDQLKSIGFTDIEKVEIKQCPGSTGAHRFEVR